MPTLRNDCGFDRAVATRVRQKLPQFGQDEAIDFSLVDADLKAYFSTYGFDRIDAKAQLGIGAQALADFDIAHFYWRVENPTAEVLVLHGLFDHTGLFLDLIEALLQAGFNVRAIDLPGHGLSSGEPVTIDNFAHYAKMIDEYIQSTTLDPELPFYALGQSTGCSALLHYVLAGRGQAFSKLVLLAPLIQPHAWQWVRLSYFLLHKFMRWYPRSFMTNSHNAEFCDFLQNNDPLQSHKISVRWVGAMRLWIKCFKHLSKSDIPTLLIQGTGDTTVNWKNNLKQIQEKLPKLTIQKVEGAMHHLVKEDDAWQKQVFKAAIDFLKGDQ